MTGSSGRSTTEEAFSSGPGSATRCPLGQTGSWFQVLTCVTSSPAYTCLSVSVSHCVCVCVGLAVSQLVLSCRTAWVRCVNGDLARRYGVSERNPAGDYWKKIPGNASWFTGKTGLFCFILVHRYLTQLCLRCVSPSLQSLQRMSCGQ